jgi:hypothetical protein
MGGPGSGPRGLSARRVVWIEARFERDGPRDTISQVARDERLCRLTVRRIKNGVHPRQRERAAGVTNCVCPLCGVKVRGEECPKCGWQQRAAA